LHDEVSRNGTRQVQILNPNGMHNLAVGVDAPVDIEIMGHAGYFIGGMNKRANITVHGNVGWSVAENIMSGMVRVKGCASECAGASGHGGLVIIEGDASSRCGISMKGCDIVVGGSVGHLSAFMAQAGHLVVCGDAGPSLGDSLYEAIIYVRGKLQGLGVDAREEPMTEADHAKLGELLSAAQMNASPRDFKRVASAKTLYHWNVEAGQEY
jgi:glutamate synthase domain-containing protein 3